MIHAKRASPPQAIPHVLLLVEHPHVYTLGKSGEASNLLLTDDELAERGARYILIDRGGDITYHGPGQLVGYPILDLDRFFTDIHRYIRCLEDAVMRTCADYGVVAGRIEGRTGVWVGPDDRGDERKICAIGIRCSRWVTMHGFAFNLNTNLEYFGYIIPCGISDRGVTSLAAEVGRPIDEAEARARVCAHLGNIFSAQIDMQPSSALASYRTEASPV
ncbi:MAG: lipoyl(octanoyl) transferase LipB [Rhodothermales bacterium]